MGKRLAVPRGDLGARDYQSILLKLNQEKTIMARTQPQEKATTKTSDIRIAPSGASGSEAKRVAIGRSRQRLAGPAVPLSPDSLSPDPRRWLILGLLIMAQFMVVLDAAIVNVALPSIQRSLGFSEAGLAWVINAYILVFGGFLLVGGRSADLFGRRRMFVSGLALFSLSSLACGVAGNSIELVAFRAMQGLGAAILSPAALSIVTTTFTETGERNKALGMWGAIGGIAAAVGLLAGGVLSAGPGWRWVFFANVPFGVALLALSPLVRGDDRTRQRGRLDLVGAALATSGLCLAVYTFFETGSAGWASATTVALFLTALTLLAGFVVWERRVADPLAPLAVFRVTTLAAANAINLLIGAVLFSTFFFLTLYLQRVWGYGPLQTGLAQLPLAGAQLLAARLASRLITRFGHRPVLASGLLLMAGSLLWLAHSATTHASYLEDVFVPSILFGAGLISAVVATFIAGQEGVPERLAGFASGLISTTLYVGGAVGLAVLGAVATARTHDVQAGTGDANTTAARALATGFQYGWTVGAICCLVGATLAIAVLDRRSDTPRQAHRSGLGGEQ